MATHAYNIAHVYHGIPLRFPPRRGHHADDDTAASLSPGHGGSDCAEILKLKLHTICAREIFSNRKESAMKENMVSKPRECRPVKVAVLFEM